MPVTWPTDLPQRVLADGYRRTGPDAVKSTKMDKGPPHTRLQTSSAPRPVDCALLLNFDRVPRFWRFYDEETVFGSKLFFIRDQILDGMPLQSGGAPLVTGSGEPITISSRWLVMFTPGQPPQESDPRGLTMRISFSLLILP